MAEWPRRCRLTVALLILLAFWDASAASAAMAPVPARVDASSNPRVSDSRGDATTAAHAGHEKTGLALGHGAKTFLNLDTERRNATELIRNLGGPGGYKKLRIAVPQKHGFKAFVNITHPNTKRQKVTGYSIDIFKAAMKKLQHRPPYEFCVVDGDYDDLVLNVSLGEFDAAVGDMTITADRASHVDFTMPYTESGVSLLVLAEDDSNPIQWIFLKPLTKELWFATVGFFFFTGFVVWMIEQPTNPEYQGSSLRQLSTASYFAFSTLTFSHGQIIRSPLSKIVVVIWCFVVLILVQSYTASLSSMLTAKRLRPSVTDLDQLLNNGYFVGYQHGGFVRSVLRKQGFRENKLRTYKTKEEYAEALRKGSKNGGVSAIVDEIPYLNSFLSDPQYRKDFQMVNRIYKTPGLGFVFPLGSPLVHDLSTAILNVTGGHEGSRIEAKWLGTGAPSISFGSPNSDSTPLTLRSFSGLFIITGCISSLMLLVSIARSVYAKYTEVRDSNMQSADGDGGSVRLGGCSALQIDMVDGPVPDQPHHEARNDYSRCVHGSGQSAGDVEPSPMQNGIYNGSVPAHSNQIEMNTG